ncbi:MAG: fibronectin type III domain-containing protein [Acidobacteriota bacterium]
MAILGYKLRLNGGGLVDEVVDVGDVLTVDLIGLTPNTEYEVEVASYNLSRELSDWSAVETATTDPDYDDDAEAFFVAASITDSTEKAAIDAFVDSLKAASIWTKMQAIYPCVGSSAAQHKFNLKDPRDLDAAFRLEFAGTITHASTGMTGDGSTGEADTNYAGATSGANNNSHISVYVRSNSAAASMTEISAYDAGSERSWAIACRSTFPSSGRCRFDNYNYIAASGADSIDFASTDARGFWINNRVSAGEFNAWKDGTKLGSGTTTSFTLPTGTLKLFTNGAAATFSDREICFASIGVGLTDIEAGAFSTAVENLQAALAREN